MPQSHLLQDWISIQGNSASDSVIMSADVWKDLSSYTDVVFYLERKDFSGSGLTLHYQTSPTQDDAMFQDMATVSISGTGLTQTTVLFATASVPLARWVRWKVDASAAWRLTFRVWMVVRAS